MNDIWHSLLRKPAPNVLVLGDLILDKYTWGNAERVSPEAPVLVLRADEHEVRPGGAASVAVLLRHLDACVTLAGVIGDDCEGQTLRKILGDEGIDRELVFEVAGRPTTTKERFVGRAANRHPHQILRVDQETREPINVELASRFRNEIQRRIAEFNVVIISDYYKGVCAPELLSEVIGAARGCQIPVVVDPARIADYTRYRGASHVKPNRVEAELATGIQIESPEDALEAGRVLVQRGSLGGALVTMDRDGIAAVENREQSLHEHVERAVVREVYDITGAGDMVIAVAGLCQAAGCSLVDTARLANIAAGLEIERFGIAPVTWEQIAERHRTLEESITTSASRTCPKRRRNLANPAAKICTLSPLVKLVEAHRQRNDTIVFTNGCFDLLHVGHVTYLQQAAELGDVLIVAINSDAGVRRLKGAQRPIIGESDRAIMLASLAFVDHVLIFDEPTPHRLLDCLRPDVLVKGGTTDEVIGREVVADYGGQVRLLSAIKSVSTTQIVSQIREPRAVARAESAKT